MTLYIRPYTPEDAPALAHIYYHTIHTVNARDYEPEQLNAWAPESSLNPDRWQLKWEKLSPLVAIQNDTIAGFAEFESNGHIDCFYVHHKHQGKGVGSALMNAIHARALQEGITYIYAEVSITAKPFFEKSGFQTLRKQSVSIEGIALSNFLMEKHLTQ